MSRRAPEPEPQAGSGRVRLVVANWKLHHTHLEAIAFLERLWHLLDVEDYRRAEIAICPAFTALRSAQLTIETDGMPYRLGAQDVFWEPSGAYTGEVSVPMLAKLDVKYVIVGHSERRRLFGETDDVVAKKAAAVASGGLVPIVCVGEVAEERAGGTTEAVLERQLDTVLTTYPVEALGELVIAYEPVWAIGSGTPATPEDAEHVARFLRDRLARRASEAVAARVRILYGGSVDVGNAVAFLAQADIDGLLVGGASLDPERFAQLLGGRPRIASTS
ncbi:triosephosphate isomerase [Acidimicrobium ferrooxidans DSM 10331]|uniref:Triosephosphate isomerase n=1 Tax=Acidimicrobium ferrooxidans (strain DSM 10331 / JCM 15462 / NBRC 103882 / ICP) TaxID=525909 RepID=C7LYI9_ACIFD|nr:triose-phosphate isomerase [Acidimicrobium ferrooxidans]ACU53797.1 triosephosphate isomerase [Acidimicrobium ferrooxidans DSM 10331]